MNYTADGRAKSPIIIVRKRVVGRLDRLPSRTVRERLPAVELDSHTPPRSGSAQDPQIDLRQPAPAVFS